jgi:amino acid adenylation domain-containing protein
MNCDSNTEILNFLYRLQNKNIYLWLSEDKKLKIYSNSELDEDTLSHLKQYKIEITAVLNNNKVYSKPKLPLIYSYTNVNETYPLSFAQERLLFIDKFEQGTNAYNMPFLFKLNQEFNIELLKTAIQNIAHENRILRSVFKYLKGKHYQQVLNEKISVSEKVVYSNDELDFNLKKHFNILFDLENEYPLKVSLFYFNNETYLTILFHHIAFDGWSIEVFLDKLNLIYNKLTTDNQQQATNNHTIQYSDFALWQKCYLSGSLLKKQLNYWKSEIEGFETLNFPVDKQRPSEFSYEGNNYLFEINKDLSIKLRLLAKEKNTTLFCILLSAYYILLHKYTHQTDLILGTPTANRHFKQIEKVIGIFVNTIPLRVKLEPDKSIGNLIDNIILLTLNVQSNQDIPFEEIVNKLKIEKDISRNPIFQTVFSVQNFGSKNCIFENSSVHKFIKIAKHDFSLFIDDSETILKADFNYSEKLFTDETIKRVSLHYLNILKSIVKDTSTNINDIQLLTDNEYQKIIYDWNNTASSVPKEKTVYALFEEQAEKHPQKTALIFENTSLTYKELNEAANNVAHSIRSKYKETFEKEITSDTLIAIYTDRNPQIIIGLLGILKSGAAYVPIDSCEPSDRLRLKVENSNCSLVLTTENLKSNVKDIEKNKYILCFEEILNSKTIYTSNLNHISSAKDLAYIIYTSGSTGSPKGVAIEHKSLINLVYTITHKHKQFTKPTPKILSLTNFDFDIFGLEIWSAFISSGTLLLIDNYRKTSPKLLTEIINSSKPEIIQGTPAILSTLLFNYLKDLKNTLFIVGGEPLFQSLAKKLCAVSDNVWNYYGPSETTIWSTCYKVENSQKILIGKPLPNQTCYILDDDLYPVPIGVIGELYIGGSGVARHYFNNEELNKNSFLTNHFVDKDNERIYRTGDKARWLPEGNIDFIGRQDNQIKLRGYRVEPGEIESAIIEHDSINQCVVKLIEKKNLKAKNKTTEIDFPSKLLIAYYTIDNKNNHMQQTNHFNFNEGLREYLYSKLPDYMIPNIFIKLDKLPLNSSGKIDTASLPNPIIELNEESYVAPLNKTELQVTRIWEIVLDIKKIGIYDNFFHLGGTSMSAIRLAHQLSSAFNKHIPIAEIFLHPTVHQLSDRIIQMDQEKTNNEIWEF